MFKSRSVNLGIDGKIEDDSPFHAPKRHIEMIRTCFLWSENTEGGLVMSRRSWQIKNWAMQGDKVAF
jgi:hypothetical protein